LIIASTPGLGLGVLQNFLTGPPELVFHICRPGSSKFQKISDWISASLLLLPIATKDAILAFSGTAVAERCDGAYLNGK
jgi:hypothetical protein